MLLGVRCQPFIFWGISHCCEFCSWVMPGISNIYPYVRNIRACEKVLWYRFSNPVPVIQIVRMVPTSMRKKNGKGKGGGGVVILLSIFLIFSHSLWLHATLHSLNTKSWIGLSRLKGNQKKSLPVPNC